MIRNPLVWVLALSSAFMYISRYAINGWGVLFLQEIKGYTLAAATQVISVNALCGIVGTVFSGWLSDAFFYGRRNVLAFGFGVLNTVALCLFLYSGDGLIVNILSMILFGVAIGVLICFLGGLMAIDIVPREATGAALGIVGMASYVGAGLQDIVSGWLINSGKTEAGRRDELQFRLGDRLLDRRVGRIVHSGALRRQTLAPVSRTQLILRIRLQEIPCSLIFYPAVPFSALSPA